ncbi:transposable element Tcb1 transposase [Trichonephila clavipes]|nr:transposable element Tcb1 transposase [Trichonephila clavipes]
MSAAEWNEVAFTDESRICLLHHDDRIRVWRQRGERMLNSCVMHRHTGPAPDNMLTKYQMIKFIDFCEVWFQPESVARVAAIVGDHRYHTPRH